LQEPVASTYRYWISHQCYVLYLLPLFSLSIFSS